MSETGEIATYPSLRGRTVLVTGGASAYATAPGQVALDGEDTRNSPYTAALSQSLAVPGISLETVFKRTRARVLEITDDQQVPWETSSITGEFFFRR